MRKVAAQTPARMRKGAASFAATPPRAKVADASLPDLDRVTGTRRCNAGAARIGRQRHAPAAAQHPPRTGACAGNMCPPVPPAAMNEMGGLAGVMGLAMPRQQDVADLALRT